MRKGLQALFDAGQFDEIVRLGKKLYIKGNAQINQSNDEGETIDEIRQTLKIVYEALQRCSLSEVEKMEQVIDWELADEFGLTDDLDVFWAAPFDTTVWSALADLLLQRLDDIPPPGGFAVRSPRRSSINIRIAPSPSGKRWRNTISSLLPKEYAVALGYLRKIQKVMNKNGREREFKAHVALLRAQHIRKIRLIEMLDSLAGKRIIDG